MFKRVVARFLVVGTLVVFCTPCFAYFEPSPWVEETSYNRKMTQKFLFGYTNLILGWLEIFQEPYQALKEDRMVWRSVGLGLFNGVVDTVGGALQVVTCFITPLDIPLPEGGTDIVKRKA